VAGHSIGISGLENIVVARPKKANASKPDFAALLAGAKLPERTVPICLRGDLAAEHEQLNDELELLERTSVDSLAGNGGAELAERIEALEAEMRANTYPFLLRGLRGPDYRAFKVKHPPRLTDDGEVDKQDAMFGFNAEAGFEPLIRVSVVDPELDDVKWAQLMQTLTDRQFDNLGTAAWLLNRGDIDVPFSRAASRLNRLTADGSKPPTD
jgi:hypothetical protein